VKTAPGVAITSDQSVRVPQATVIFTAATLGGSANITLNSVTLGQSAIIAVSIQSFPTNIAVTNAVFKGRVAIDNIQSSNHQERAVHSIQPRRLARTPVLIARTSLATTALDVLTDMLTNILRRQWLRAAAHRQQSVCRRGPRAGRGKLHHQIAQ
jgi:hypothetical protein